MAGWEEKRGVITKDKLSEEEIWSIYATFFSTVSKKRSTYKYGLIKAINDNLYNASLHENGWFISYTDLFEKFSCNYWNLIVKYHLKQIRPDGKSNSSVIEKEFLKSVDCESDRERLEFESIDEEERIRLVNVISKECRKNVIPALYVDSGSVIYEFDLKGPGIFLHKSVYDFLNKYKHEIEKLNYFYWAKFLESINDDDVLANLLTNLELATPKRKDMSVYREILWHEFQEGCCFYCGRKLKKQPHVDHFIPWSYVKDDKIWNLVLSCSECNIKKSNHLPDDKSVKKIITYNESRVRVDNIIVARDFNAYNEDTIRRLWLYARRCGYR